MSRTQDDWIAEYQAKNALWIHDGNLKRPHALLTSGMHSNGFFNSRLVIPDETLLREAAHDLLELLMRHSGSISQAQGVVGPQTGATKLAEFMSDDIRSITGSSCFWASPAKKGDKTAMIFNDEERLLLPKKTVLLCEDVLTTGGSVDLTARAVSDAQGNVLPFILVLVNRSGLEFAGGKKVVALINRPMPMWVPEECPLCKKRSVAVHPKDNWNLLNATY